MIFNVDQITLTNLLAEVQAINASGTGTSCTLTMAAIDPSSETTEWTVYDPLVTAAFTKATQNVQAIGLSFGGTCFFETGVTADYSGTPPSYEIFSSNFSEH